MLYEGLVHRSTVTVENENTSATLMEIRDGAAHWLSSSATRQTTTTEPVARIDSTSSSASQLEPEQNTTLRFSVTNDVSTSRGTQTNDQSVVVAIAAAIAVILPLVAGVLVWLYRRTTVDRLQEDRQTRSPFPYGDFSVIDREGRVGHYAQFSTKEIGEEGIVLAKKTTDVDTGASPTLTRAGQRLSSP